MNKKRYILVVGIILIGAFSLVILNSKLDNKETKLDEVKLKDNKVNNKGFAIMIQKEDKTGYDVYEENTWPTEGYTFNSELSGCIDNYGSIIENSLSYNEDTNIITVDTGVTSSCYVYFDIKNNALGQYIIDNSISGLDKTFVGDETNGYDTLYRFSGTNGNTGINNYICLGTTSKCESGSDNMYRIIGVEPSTGYVKIIKQTKYGENIAWNSSTGVTWPNSSSYSTMTTWYNSVSFKSMIVSHSWGITDFTSAPTTRVNAISVETITSTTTAYVGMLAVLDYYLAYRGDQNWNSSYSNYTSNWMHLANNGNASDAEWTMSRFNINSAWSLTRNGRVYNTLMTGSSAVRPVFYLNSTVNRISGSGTIADPFIVS